MAKRLTKLAIEKLLKKTAGWALAGKAIKRRYTFSEFVSAMAFVNHVAAQAETMNHHPDVLIQYNKVTLTLSTHSAGGLTPLDFKLVKKIDA